jgi:hypothetical protein
LGAADRYRRILYQDVGHAYTPEMRAEKLAWFAQWLQPQSGRCTGLALTQSAVFHGLTIVPSRRRSVPRFRPGEVYGNLAATFSSISIPRPGLSFVYM